MEFKTVIEKEVLLEQLKKNKTRYVETRKDLVKVYEEKVAEYKETYTEYTQKEILGNLTVKDIQPHAPIIPEDRTETYDWYISMVEHHCGNRLRIDDKMFRKLFLDKWGFITEHIHALMAWASADTSSTYSTTTSAALSAYTE